jgi:hypothetical protein
MIALVFAALAAVLALAARAKPAPVRVKVLRR